MCKPGTYADTEGSARCRPCPAGTHSSAWGSIKAGMCQASGAHPRVARARRTGRLLLIPGLAVSSRGREVHASVPGPQLDLAMEQYCCCPLLMGFAQRWDAPLCPQECEPGHYSDHPGANRCKVCRKPRRDGLRGVCTGAGVLCPLRGGCVRNEPCNVNSKLRSNECLT